MEQHGITLYHLLATGGGGLLGTLAIVHRLWLAPLHKAKVELEVWKAKVEERLKQGEHSFVRHAEKDDAILSKLTAIEERLRKLEQAFAGVAPALKGGE